MPQFKIPIAKSENGSYIFPKEGVKNTRYYCPNCGELVILKAGNIKKPHFAHKHTGQCSYETVIHKVAKRILVQNINDFANNNGGSPEIVRVCKACSKNKIVQYLPETITSASEEIRLSNGYVVDVSLEKDSIPVAAIEVLVTHKVSEIKAKTLGIPFIEVDGESVIQDPMALKPINDHFDKFICEQCVNERQEYESKLEEVSQKSNVPIPGEFYRTGISICWKCDNPILVFTWPGKQEWTQEKPNGQCPKTLEFRKSNTLGSMYLANTCPYCQALQGDFYLSRPNNPFFNFNCGEDTPEDFQKDKEKLFTIHTYFKIY